MGVKLVQLAEGKIIGTGDIHLEELVPVDTSVPSSYIETWDISKGANDKVTAYLTGSGNNLSLHIYGTGEMKDFAQIVPVSYPYYTAYWAGYTSRIKQVYIHNGVTNIGQLTFFGFTGNYNTFNSLSVLSIAETVREINRYAFSYAHINSINIPQGVRHIHEGAFSSFDSYNSVITISGSVRRIDYSAFNNCLAYANGFTICGDGCLIQNTGTQTSLTIPQGVKSVSLFNWSNKQTCTEVTLPTGVRYLAVGAFSGFSSLQTIKLPEGLKSIAFNAFSNTPALRSVYIPQSVTRISSRSIMTATAQESCLPGLSPFYNANANLKLYCGASSKPQGYDEYWDYIGDSARATVYWGVTEQEYDETEVNV